MFRRHRPDLSSVLAERLHGAAPAGDLPAVLVADLDRAPISLEHELTYDLNAALVLRTEPYGCAPA